MRFIKDENKHENRNQTYNRSKISFMVFVFMLIFAILTIRLVDVMIFQSEYYNQKAKDIQQRERKIKAARGKILDANGTVLADSVSVCTISVIHSQIKEPERVIEVLSKELGMSEEKIRTRVEKVSSMEKIKSNVDKEVGDKILSYGLSGVKIDQDYRRCYPFDSLASKVLGFTGADNQGIIGLEVKYDSYLMGTNGTILTTTDARGREVKHVRQERIEPVNGKDLHLSLDYNIQKYCMQAAQKTYIQKEAEGVEVIAMNPQNGEILAMVDYPEYNLNDPFTLIPEATSEDCNQMWRNWCVSDTYEPGSIFKIVTAAAALEEQLVSVDEAFFCPGYIMVEDRRIRCHKTTGHGAQTFETGIWNSCNPVFISVGTRIGAERFYSYFQKFGLMEKTGIDLSGEAGTIMHKKEKIGPVELATISFGQSFQISPIRMAATVASIINGGYAVTPHFGVCVTDADGQKVWEFPTEKKERICSSQTSETMQKLLLGVVSEGGGEKAYIEGYEIGGKTATSQLLPRSERKYISSFLGFAPADDPQILVMVIIRKPHGIYYGGTIAAPVAKEIFENILPYLKKNKK